MQGDGGEYEDRILEGKADLGLMMMKFGPIAESALHVTLFDNVALSETFKLYLCLCALSCIEIHHVFL